MTSFLEETKAIVNQAQSIHELMNIMDHIPFLLQTLKAAINESLDAMGEDRVRSIHYQTHSIEDVIPFDVIQSALSYIPHQVSIKSVSESFQQLAQQNEILQERSREQMIASKFKGKNVWNVRKVNNCMDPASDGMRLQRNEEPSMIIHGLDEVFGKIESGDKIFFHKGEYGMSEEFAFGHKDVQIEGIGPWPCEFTPLCEDQEDKIINHNASIKNVEFLDTRFHVKQGGSLYLTDCVFGTWMGVRVDSSGKLDCNGCRFEGDDYHGCGSGIYASGACSLSVENCLFDGCGGEEEDPCISIEETKKMNLKLIGNTFKNVYKALPIGKAYGQRGWVNDQAIVMVFTKFLVDLYLLTILDSS